jgi:hypothetical protein
MDEVSSQVRLNLPTSTARPRQRLFNLVLESESEEKREPASDIDTAVVDSLKRLTSTSRLEKRTSSGHRVSVDFDPFQTSLRCAVVRLWTADHGSDFEFS